MVYPAGTGLLRTALTWNAGPGCCGFAQEHDVDDVGFVSTLLEDLAARHPIDNARIFVTGHSNGSMMAYRVAAEMPSRIAGVVGVAGTMQLPSVKPRGPVPILHIHSEDDPRAFYEGGERDDRNHPPVPAMLALWQEANGCASSPTEVDTRVGPPATGRSGAYRQIVAVELPGRPPGTLEALRPRSRMAGAQGHPVLGTGDRPVHRGDFRQRGGLEVSRLPGRLAFPLGLPEKQ